MRSTGTCNFTRIRDWVFPTSEYIKCTKNTNIYPFERVILGIVVLTCLELFQVNSCIFIIYLAKPILSSCHMGLQGLSAQCSPCLTIGCTRIQKGFLICVRTFIALPFLVTWITLLFYQPFWGSLFLLEMLLFFLRIFQT